MNEPVASIEDSYGQISLNVERDSAGEKVGPIQRAKGQTAKDVEEVKGQEVQTAKDVEEVEDQEDQPAKIRAKVSPNSYEVECDDGSVKRLHANHLRAYHERVNAVGLVFENDEEFGDLECVPIKLDEITETLDEKFEK